MVTSLINSEKRQVSIQVKNISKRFKTRKNITEALTNVSVDVKEGEFFCIVGPIGGYCHYRAVWSG